jgi:hypothetical protein
VFYSSADVLVVCFVEFLAIFAIHALFFVVVPHLAEFVGQVAQAIAVSSAVELVCGAVFEFMR